MNPIISLYTKLLTIPVILLFTLMVSIPPLVNIAGGTVFGLNVEQFLTVPFLLSPVISVLTAAFFMRRAAKQETNKEDLKYALLRVTPLFIFLGFVLFFLDLTFYNSLIPPDK